MFGTNELVGKKYFKDQPAGSLLVASAPFATLQGEGPYSGQRAVFVRLAKCNYACSFCDTAFDKGTLYSFEELMKAIVASIEVYRSNHGAPVTEGERAAFKPFGEYAALTGWGLVITGGEPLLQEALFSFIERLYGGGYAPWDLFKWVQIESNGIPAVEDELHEGVTLVVSPKCPERNGVTLRHSRPHVSTLRRADCLKFVVTADQSSPYSTVPDWATEWRDRTGKTIYVSPMNVYLREPAATLLAAKSNRELDAADRAALERISFWEEGLLDREANQQNHEYTAALAVLNGFTLSLQTHLLASLP